MGAAVTVLLLTLAGLAAPADPEAALAAGNRLFEKDRLEAALEAYAKGYAGDGSPMDGALAYNAGTCALRLGRLPEALLWYRRAEAATPEDPWLRDNLATARRALADQPEKDPAWELWLENRRGLAVAGVVLAWVTALLFGFSRRFPRPLLALLALLSCAAFAAGLLLDRLGPRAAVLLAACRAQGHGGLPAGREVWVRPAGDGGWHILGEDGLRCPEDAVGLVEP